MIYGIYEIELFYVIIITLNGKITLEILFVRHGKTTWNIEKKMQGEAENFFDFAWPIIHFIFGKLLKAYNDKTVLIVSHYLPKLNIEDLIDINKISKKTKIRYRASIIFEKEDKKLAI